MNGAAGARVGVTVVHRRYVPASHAHYAGNLVDGAYFNSGQSCCGIQRVYVHERAYDTFVERWIDLTRKYVLGNPLESETTLGPVHGRVRPWTRIVDRRPVPQSTV